MFGIIGMKTFYSLQDSRIVLRSLLENPSSNVEEIYEVVESDPNMSAFVLKVANDPLFGIEGKIDDVNRAIDLLGIGQVSEMLSGVLATFPLNTSVILPKVNNANFCLKTDLGLTKLAIT